MKEVIVVSRSGMFVEAGQVQVLQVLAPVCVCLEFEVDKNTDFGMMSSFADEDEKLNPVDPL